VIIGVPKEIKTREYRVGMTPAGVRSLTSRGHKVLVEKGAGAGAGLKDDDYDAAGAQIVGSAADAWARTWSSRSRSRCRRSTASSAKT
jgi:alanine dehydrogenase